MVNDKMKNMKTELADGLKLLRTKDDDIEEENSKISTLTWCGIFLGKQLNFVHK